MSEILFALAALANIASLVLQLWREYKHQRMEAEEKVKPGGNRVS